MTPRLEQIVSLSAKTVLICEDNELIIKGLLSMSVTTFPDSLVVVVTNLEELLQLPNTILFDAVIIDPGLCVETKTERLNVIELASKKVKPFGKVAIHTGVDDANEQKIADSMGIKTVVKGAHAVGELMETFIDFSSFSVVGLYFLNALPKRWYITNLSEIDNRVFSIYARNMRVKPRLLAAEIEMESQKFVQSLHRIGRKIYTMNKRLSNN